MIPIKGAVSFETAHYIDDYPAGFTARVHKKMWIETKKGKGQRGVYATTSKHNDAKWCAPKANTYDELCGIAIIEGSDVVPGGKWTADDIGHAVWCGWAIAAMWLSSNATMPCSASLQPSMSARP